MRTFHTGGIAGEDITHGLPRVVELFEARTPKGAAVLARTSGVVRITEEDNVRRILVVGDDGTEDIYNVSAPGPSWPTVSSTAPRSPPAIPSSTAPRTPSSCSTSRASGRPSSTSSARSSRSTGTRACRSTTSTSS